MNDKKKVLKSMRSIKNLIEVKDIEIRELERKNEDIDPDLADIFDGTERPPEADRMLEIMKEEKVILVERYEAIYDAIKRLPDKHRIVLERHYVLGETYAEIADVIDYSERSVYNFAREGIELIDLQK